MNHRTLIAAVMALSLTTFAHAEGLNASACIELEALARTIMKARQQGVPMAGLVKAIENTNTGVPEADDVAMAMVISAYEQSGYQVERNQQRAIDEFASDAMVRCFKTIQKAKERTHE